MQAVEKYAITHQPPSPLFFRKKNYPVYEGLRVELLEIHAQHGHEVEVIKVLYYILFLGWHSLHTHWNLDVNSARADAQ